MTVAGWFAEGFIQSIAAKAVEIATNRLAHQWGIKDNVEKLKHSLLKVGAVLEDAEERQTKDRPKLQSLMKELKIVVYEAEDFLDGIDYHILEQKIESEGDNSASEGNLDRVTKDVKNLLSGVGKEATDIQGKLDRLAKDVKDIIVTIPMKNKKKRKLHMTPIRETTSCSYEAKLIGREKELEQLVKLLTHDADVTGDSNFSVVTLYGIGGVGKTTLAQFVFNDDRVKNFFDLKAWVCISDCFDERRITKEIIESMTREKHSDINLDILQSILRENITSKKILLVLDDAWNEDSNRWEKLCAPLRYAAPGSKILLTTRLQIIADNIGSRDKVQLKGLEEVDFWQLFQKCAFGSQNLEKNSSLVPIGRKIAQKLKGTPLAAKTIGNLLRSDLNEKHWSAIEESELWELPQKDTDILPALQLSYEYLPAHLKQCFGYCSLFPKDYQFSKNELVYLWMSQGYILCEENMRIEDVGVSYIDYLIGRCFFEEKDYLQDNDKVIMHDLLHDLAEFAFIGENFRNESCTLASTERVLNAAINDKYLQQSELKNICNKNSTLRTLMIMRSYIGINSDNAHWLTSPRCIRTLTLTACGIKELPNSINILKHLCYLDISENEIEVLPETLCSLYKLLYLNILDLPLKNMPIGMCKLINLRCLRLRKHVIPMIDNIGKMTSLQELREFKVSCEQGHMISELKNLRQLHHALYLKGLEVIMNKEEASQSKLNEKMYLDMLLLEWEEGNRNYDNDTEVIEGLQPHGNLKRLFIKYYGGFSLPGWLNEFSLPRINELFLWKCHNLENIDCVGELPNLEILDIGGNNAVKSFNHKVCGGYSTLKEIHIYGMQELQSWTIPNGQKSFPRLDTLYVRDCPKLTAISLLDELEINMFDMSNLNLVDRVHGLTSLKKFTVRNCPNLMPVNPNKKDICYLLPSSIEDLQLIDCGYLDKAVQSGLHTLTSMTDLGLWAHQNTNSSEAQGCLLLPPSVRSLWLGCLDNNLCDSKLCSLNNMKFVSTLWICGCSGIHSLPMDLFLNLNALSNLYILYCKELRSLEGIQVLKSLKELWIGECPMLSSSSEDAPMNGDLSISTLLIDNSTLLKLPQLQSSLHSIQRIRFRHSKESTMLNDTGDRELLRNLKSLRFIEFYRCKSLQFLPADMDVLSSLEILVIDFCPNIQSLPDGTLPKSLECAILMGCHRKLEMQLKKYKEEMLRRKKNFYLRCSDENVIRDLPEKAYQAYRGKYLN